MSDKYTSQFAGTTESLGKGTAEKMSLETTARKLTQRMVQTSRDLTWLFVPDTRGSDRKISVADSQQLC